MATIAASRTTPDELIDNVVRKLQQVHVNLLAIDFDYTFIDIHTRGNWPGQAIDLVPHARPDLCRLIAAALSTGNIHVAIVTFSRQPAMVKQVLEGALGLEMAEKIPVRANDHSWQYSGAGSRDGKQAYMASAVEELLRRNEGVEITKSSTLLIDDDEANIRLAIDDGVRAVWFCPKKPHRLLQDLLNLV